MNELKIKSHEIKDRISEIQRKLTAELESYHIDFKVHAVTKNKLTDLVNGYYSGILPKDGVTEEILRKTHRKHYMEKSRITCHERKIKEFKILLKMYNRIYSKLE
jgi:hypothetical protein